MGEVRRELQGMWNWTKRCNLSLWKMTLAEGFGEGQNKCIDWPRDRDVGARDDSRYLNKIKEHLTSQFVLYRPGSWVRWCALWWSCHWGMKWLPLNHILVHWLYANSYIQHRLARYMGLTRWLLPMMGQWKEAPSTQSQLRSSWEFRCSNKNHFL